jgi:hypothetical protein
MLSVGPSSEPCQAPQKTESVPSTNKKQKTVSVPLSRLVAPPRPQAVGDEDRPSSLASNPFAALAWLDDVCSSPKSKTLTPTIDTPTPVQGVASVDGLRTLVAAPSSAAASSVASRISAALARAEHGRESTPPQVDGRKSISQKTITLTPSQEENSLVGGEIGSCSAAPPPSSATIDAPLAPLAPFSPSLVGTCSGEVVVGVREISPNKNKKPQGGFGSTGVSPVKKKLPSPLQAVLSSDVVRPTTVSKRTGPLFKGRPGLGTITVGEGRGGLSDACPAAMETGVPGDYHLRKCVRCGRAFLGRGRGRCPACLPPPSSSPPLWPL